MFTSFLASLSVRGNARDIMRHVKSRIRTARDLGLTRFFPATDETYTTVRDKNGAVIKKYYLAPFSFLARGF